MIENLNGIHETVNYRENTNIRMYDNTDYEEYPPHWHTALEIIMPLKNEYPLKYGDRTCSPQENEILIICPGVLHHLKATPGQRIIFQAELSSFSQIREVESVTANLSPGLLITPETFPDTYGHIHRLMEEIVTEYFQSSPLFEASIYARLLEILVIIGRSHTGLGGNFHAGSSKQLEYMEKFIDICNYISEHCTEDLTLDQVADRCGFSKYHFTRLFKQFTNVSFYKYLNQKRIARAEQLLINPSASITDVSLSCGFSSLSAFIRMFKIIKGCTPSQFRSMYEAPD
ncbi:MAG: AraC family transcriptional regulator [Lachnospiraceae bacterium]|nr:AraC family transcriptional regulator [Lachnospiraceae bacterium]